MLARSSLTIAALLICSSTGAAELGYYSQPALYGNRIVFVSEGDLWTATLPDDEGERIVAFRLTSGDGIESHPTISGDGQSIAFAAQYDGNVDLYVMPMEGGAPQRLTFHPAPDIPLAWTADSRRVLLRSPRAHHFGRDELWRVDVRGGIPERYPIGECSAIALSSGGNSFAFTPYSNETWHWKGYRGGTAPEIWVGEFNSAAFIQITHDESNDLHPMWLGGRVYFLSDRSGTYNIFSADPFGGEVKRHTHFARNEADLTAIETYDIRWASGDAQPRGTRIIFCQAGALAIHDTADDSLRRLDVRLASDRVSARARFDEVSDTLTRIALSPDGTTLLVESRGELLAIDVETGVSHQLTRTSGAREWGAAYLDDEQIALITDASGEQQIAVMPADGSSEPLAATSDREDWLFPVAASPDGGKVAFGDKTMRLHVLDLAMLRRDQVDQSQAGEITDYRFSPDSRWLAYTMLTPGDFSEVRLYSLNTHKTFPVSTGMSNDREPRWDPAGRYLYFLSDRHLDPVMSRFDLDHVYIDTAQICVVPLSREVPPPFPDAAKGADFDLDAWAGDEEAEAEAEEDDDAAPDADGPPAQQDLIVERPGPAGEEGADEQQSLPMRLDTEGLAQRQYLLPIAPGNYRNLEAIQGGVLYLSESAPGLLSEDWIQSTLKEGEATLYRYAILDQEAQVLAEEIETYIMSRDGSSVAYPAEGKVIVQPLNEGEDAEQKEVDLSEARIRIDVASEWRQMLEEAWRLQRDFYWAPNLTGVDWSAIRQRYSALLHRIGTREELNDLIGEMIGELGSSHAYIWGGSRHEREEAEEVNVGALGADLHADRGVLRITRILPSQTWSGQLHSPLDAAHLDVQEGDLIVAVDGQPLNPGLNIHDLLQDKADRSVRLAIADSDGANRRTIEVRAMNPEAEAELRYLAWVDARRQEVAEASDGKIGYVHIPDMMGRGLSLFDRQFLPQFQKPALLIDVRDNGGGFVSQVILERLNQRVLGYDQPRHGMTRRYPYRAPHAHMAVLINQHAGSDGDIFPAAFRMAGLGRLIGTRTWGGVVGIRGDKLFVDAGLSTQPEFAWWDERGWSIENQGVSPDIEVPLTPSDRVRGDDPQLQRGIEYLLDELAKDPRDLPPVPVYPMRR